MAAEKGIALQEAAVALAREGLQSAEIAVRLGRSRACVHTALFKARRAGVDVPWQRRGGTPGAVTAQNLAAEARRVEIASLSTERLGPWEIAAITGCTASAVSTVMCRMRREGARVPKGKPGRPRKTSAT